MTRPIGQVILAGAVALLVAGGKSLKHVYAKLEAFERQGGFGQHLPSSIWYEVMYNFTKDSVNTRPNLQKAAELLAYMVHGADQGTRKALLDFVVRSRMIETAKGPKWVSFAGKEETIDPDDPTNGKDLPTPIRK